MEAKVALRCLQTSDFSAVDKLREAAGWNQTLADWQRMLALDPQGCFVAEDQERVVGSATTTSFGSDLAWIGMVLVDPPERNRGIGRRLLMHCLEYLQGKGVRCIKLDATPAGQILYEKLGFKVEWPLARWMKTADPREIPLQDRDVVSAKADDWSEIEELDRKVFGFARAQFLRSLSEDSAQTVICRGTDDAFEGFGFLRDGVNAGYIGPIAANTDEAGKSIVRHLLRATQRPVYWDIPNPCAGATHLATELKFIQQRPFLRMYLGKNESAGNPRQVWGISDPATG